MCECQLQALQVSVSNVYECAACSQCACSTCSTSNVLQSTLDPHGLVHCMLHFPHVLPLLTSWFYVLAASCDMCCHQSTGLPSMEVCSGSGCCRSGR
jgi:hypothetical protein